jgi:glycosyltransferase involved in cell wall biosynthesis
MKRIMYVVRQAEGGMARHVLDLITHIDRERFEPIVVTAEGGQILDRALAMGITIEPLHVSDAPDLSADIATVRALRSLYKKYSPDLIHIHGYKAALVGMVARSTMMRRAPVIITMHNYPSYNASSGMKRRLGRCTLRWLARRACRIISVSNDLKDHLIEQEGISPDKVSTIHNGIDARALVRSDRTDEIATFKSEHGMPEDSPVIGTIGRMVPVKGFDVLLGAFRQVSDKLPDARLVIVGHGPDEDRLKKLSGSLGIDDKVVFPGFIRDADMLFQLFDVFVFSSIREPFGIVLLEAMAHGVPIVASNSGGAPEIIEDGKSGLLIDPQKAGDMAMAIDRSLTDYDLIRKMPAEERTRVEKYFSLELMVEATQHIYGLCLKT